MKSTIFSATHVARHLVGSRERLLPLAGDTFNYYWPVEEAVAAYLMSGHRHVLREHAERLNSEAQGSSSRMRTRAEDNLLCLQAFSMVASALPPLSYNFMRVPAEQEPLSIGGLKIQVRPLMAIQRRRADGALEVGALMLNCSKHHPLTPHAADYLTGFMRSWARRRLRHLGKVRSSLVLLLDLNAGEVYRAPLTTPGGPQGGWMPYGALVSGCQDVARHLGR